MIIHLHISLQLYDIVNFEGKYNPHSFVLGFTQKVSNNLKIVVHPCKPMITQNLPNVGLWLHFYQSSSRMKDPPQVVISSNYTWAHYLSKRATMKLWLLRFTMEQTTCLKAQPHHCHPSKLYLSILPIDLKAKPQTNRYFHSYNLSFLKTNLGKSNFKANTLEAKYYFPLQNKGEKS